MDFMSVVKTVAPWVGYNRAFLSISEPWRHNKQHFKGSDSGGSLLLSRYLERAEKTPMDRQMRLRGRVACNHRQAAKWTHAELWVHQV